MTPIPLPDPSVAASLERLARTELSFRSRLAHVLLALAASTKTIVVVALWLTEPALPLRTAVAFGLLTVIGLAWVTYSVWVLTARRVMLARQRVVAGRLAVAFAGAFTTGTLLLGLTTALPAAWPAAAMGLVLLAVALVVWWRAQAAYAMLLARKDSLERQLTRGER